MEKIGTELSAIRDIISGGIDTGSGICHKYCLEILDHLDTCTSILLETYKSPSSTKINTVASKDPIAHLSIRDPESVSHDLSDLLCWWQGFMTGMEKNGESFDSVAENGINQVRDIRLLINDELKRKQ